MKHEDFDGVVDAIMKECKRVLSNRSEHYSSESDRLHNFKRAAALLETTPEDALAGMWTKHIVSVFDMIDNIENQTDLNLWNEKLHDLINYAILLKALIIERHSK